MPTKSKKTAVQGTTAEETDRPREKPDRAQAGPGRRAGTAPARISVHAGSRWRQPVAAESGTWHRTPRLVRAIPSILITTFTTILLVVFLVPFLYMIMTSLKTQEQFAFANAPIWPVHAPDLGVCGREHGHVYGDGGQGAAGSGRRNG